MRLTRATDYAVRALVAIARAGPVERSDLRTLARGMGAPPAFLGKVLQRLRRAGLVEGARGAHGGYSLARAPEGITVRDVVEAIEGRTSLSACLAREDRGKTRVRPSAERPDRRTKPCPRTRTCGARRLWSRLEERLNEALESETIGALAAGGAKRPGKRRACGTTRRR